MKVKTNLASGIFFTVFGGILLACLDDQVILIGNTRFIESVKVMPFLVEMIMIICGCILIVQSLVFKKEEIVEIKWNDQKEALSILGILAIYAILVYFIGFLIGSVGFALLMALYFKNKNILSIVLLCLLGIGIYFLFTNIFHISLPGIGGAR